MLDESYITSRIELHKDLAKHLKEYFQTLSLERPIENINSSMRSVIESALRLNQDLVNVIMDLEKQRVDKKKGDKNNKETNLELEKMGDMEYYEAVKYWDKRQSQYSEEENPNLFNNVASLIAHKRVMVKYLPETKGVIKSVGGINR